MAPSLARDDLLQRPLMNPVFFAQSLIAKVLFDVL